MKKILTHDIDEATYYVLYGAKFDGVREKVLNKTTALRRGYPIEYSMYLINVPIWAVTTWRTYQAYGNITEFTNVRRRLKKLLKRGIKEYKDE